jgi:ABC-type amino acid transport substrate-binding protein
MKTLSCIAVLLLALSSSFAGAQVKTITFGTDPDYPPFEYFDVSTSTIRGYDIDIAEALCKQMGAHCIFKDASLIELLNRLNKGEYDAVIRAMAITSTHQQQADFTNPYYATNGSFVAASDAHLSLDKQKLAGRVIAVEEDTAFAGYVKSQYANVAIIKPYEHLQEAFNALSNKQVDVVLGDTPVINQWLRNQAYVLPGGYEIIGRTGPDKNIFGDGFGIAVRKGNTALLNDLNKALAAIKANGTYDNITAQYFGN